MKIVILVSTLVALCLATLARAHDVFVAFGDRYRISAVNSSVMLTPEAPFATPTPARALTREAQLTRSDQFVALVLESQGLAGPGHAGLVRDRVEARPGNRRWVLYAQRHQGYRIIGAGGRLELDAYGRVRFAGLTYEAESLRTFRPMTAAALEKLAAAAVPLPREGPPVSQELMIDPLGDAPAELRAYVIYEVKNNDHFEGWQVTIDAETGRVLDSFSMALEAAPSGPRHE